MTEDQIRYIVATQAAHTFLLDFLFQELFIDLREPLRTELADAIRKASARTEQFAGATKGNDVLAERLSDVVVQTQQLIGQAIDRATLAAKTAESLAKKRG